MLGNEDEWVVYRAKEGRNLHLACEPRADWDDWLIRVTSNTQSYPEWESVELVAAGLTETVAREMVRMARGMTCGGQ